MRVIQDLLGGQSKGLMTKKLLLENEAQSIFFKKELFKSQSVVSDHEICTLEFESSRHLIQKLGYKLAEDALFPYLVKDRFPLGEVLSSLDIFNFLPDLFFEEDLKNIVVDYLRESKDGSVALARLEKSFELYSYILESKISPKIFNKLTLNNLEINKNIQILSDHLIELPFSFQEKFKNDEGVVIEEDSLLWRDQLSLVEECQSNDLHFNYFNFKNQIEEVRYALKEVQKNKKTLILYPENRGYENLFFIYQREFFKDQVFFYKNFKKNLICKFLSKKKAFSRGFISHYDESGANKNIGNFVSKDICEMTFSKFISENFSSTFYEFDLNLVSKILNNLGDYTILTETDWLNILENSYLIEKKKSQKMYTTLPIQNYSYLSNQEVESIYILGWGDEIFSTSGEKVFSSQVLRGFERDLGIELPSLYKSSARDLFKNRVFKDKKIKKNICYSKVSAKGISNLPGVFKILSEKLDTKKEIKRNKIERNICLKRKKVFNENKNLSQSSLNIYEQCPYKFYLEKVIRLNSKDEEDRFLNPKEEGVILHKLLEELNREQITKKAFEEKIFNLCRGEEDEFEKYRSSIAYEISNHLWSIFKGEKELIENSGAVVFSEKKFSFSASLHEKKFSENVNSKDYVIRGVVDRIDVNKDKKAIFYDYKRGQSGVHLLSNYTGEKLYPQLFLYCIAANYSFKKEFQEIIGFQFINLKEYKRTGGYLKQSSFSKEDSFFKKLNVRSVIVDEKYNEKIEIFLKSFWSLLERIDANQFDPTPNPIYSDVCKSCQWKGVCKNSETFL